MQTGDLATLKKLVRVAPLMPVVPCIVLVIRMKLTSISSLNAQLKPTGFPLLLIAVVALIIINSVF